jgi:hypothetical protein
MWLLKLKGGVELTEGQLEYWDNVPMDVEIEALALVQSRNGKMLVHDFRGYEEYCCARMAVAGSGGPGENIGYCMYGVKAKIVTETEITRDGTRTKSYPREKSDVPERCWRKGITT